MQREKTNNSKLWLLAGVALLSRLPFLGAGYGIEEDSWGIAVAMHNTIETGIPEASRLPGHPVHELLLAVLWGLGARAWEFNLISAIGGSVCMAFFGLILKQLGFRQYLLGALAFAFIPVIYITSTYTIDYMWTMMFVLSSYYALICKRLWLAGILLGLAIGCRVTSAAMMVPFAIHLWQNDSAKAGFARVFKTGIAAFIVGVISYIPVIAVYGKSFFTYSDQFPYPSFAKIFYKGTLGVFGLIGLLAVLVFAALILIRKKQRDSNFKLPLPGKLTLEWWSVIVLYIIMYFALPQKSAYLIPLVPFVVLLFTRYLTREQFSIFAGCLILSSFFFSINLTDPYRGARHSKYSIKGYVSGQEVFIDPFSGPVISDLSKRRQKMAFTNKVRLQANAMNEKAVIISGWWYNMILTELYDDPGSPNIVYTFYSDEAEMKRYISEGYSIYYLPEQNKFNDLNFKMEVTDQLAMPFIPDF